MEPQKRIDQALNLIRRYGGIEGGHHKDWVLDQVVRALTDCPTETRSAYDYRNRPYTYEALGESPEYLAFVADARSGEDGPETYEWNVGIAP